MTGAPVLAAQALTKTFRNGEEETPVLKGVDLTLAAGEMVALLGPSGSGKSTLLTILGLLLTPTSGTLVQQGERTAGLSERALSRLRNARLGFVFQFHHLLPDFTALENVAFPVAADAGGISPALRARARHLLERVGLAERIDFRATRLSGGQKQRVAIARALINQPALILADEPTGNLDRESSAQVMALLRAINRAEGTCFLISTHDPEIAAQCDRRIHMVDGRVVRAD